MEKSGDRTERRGSDNMEIRVQTANMDVLECFASETRVKIIELLGRRPMNIRELAEALGISSAIVTKHVQKMEDAGIVRTESVSGTRGRRKVCHLDCDTITLKLKVPESPQIPGSNRYSVSIPIGQYSDYRVKPTCGLASETAIIGIVDDPRYFASPERTEAKHIWFAGGYVQYRIPNYLVGRQQVRELTISLEICSEAPEYNEHWPSDISFFLNGVALGTWTCPGDFGGRRGVYTPAWWNLGTQFGLLKTISVRREGTFLDGVRISDVTPADLGIVVGRDIVLRIENGESAVHAGGISLFGRKFGNYDQDIEVTIVYE